MAGTNEMVLNLQANAYFEHSISVYRDPGFLKYVDLLHSADLSVANLECAIIDGDEWPNYGGGMGWSDSYLGAPPSMVDQLKFLGINALCAANNHAADFGERGILATMKHLGAGGIPFAGIGASLTEAAHPCYVSTAHGRVALISVADFGPRERMDLSAPWPSGYMGSDDGPWYTSRPGVNLLRYDAELHIGRDAVSALRQISETFNWERAKAGRRVGAGQGALSLSFPGQGWEVDTDRDYYFMGRKFVIADDPGTIVTYPYPEDLARLIKNVQDARRAADVVVVALHDQVHGDTDYVNTTAHACIDAGADVFLCNGGTGKGVEIYEGKVFLHGVVGFGFQNSQVRHVPPSLLKRRGLPADGSAADFYHSRQSTGDRAAETGGLPRAYQETANKVLHSVVFNERCEPVEVRMFPSDELGGNRHRLPVLLEPGTEQFTRVLNAQNKLCEALGSTVQLRDTYGVVEVK